ncbi:MAG TPA: CinA family protein [Alphaproteobacteria bacterium]|nr:CinA family protein [Alphaproteobacteria bacterium]
MLPADIHDLARKVIESYAEQKRRIVTAESCTGGLIAGALTDIPGASDVLERGFVSYSNAAKIEVLGVMPDVLESYGAVSAQIAEAMAKGALEFSHADVAVSVTGIAGPGGGSSDKPVGLVYLGLADRKGAVFHYKCQFKGERDEVRMAAVREALKLLLSATTD